MNRQTSNFGTSSHLLVQIGYLDIRCGKGRAKFFPLLDQSQVLIYRTGSSEKSASPDARSAWCRRGTTGSCGGASHGDAACSSKTSASPAPLFSMRTLTCSIHSAHASRPQRRHIQLIKQMEVMQVSVYTACGTNLAPSKSTNDLRDVETLQLVLQNRQQCARYRSLMSCQHITDTG